MAIQARNGMIAFHKGVRAHSLPRTSTCLIRNIIEFRRRLEHIVKHVIDWSKIIITTKQEGRRRRQSRLRRFGEGENDNDKDDRGPAGGGGGRVVDSSVGSAACSPLCF